MTNATGVSTLTRLTAVAKAKSHRGQEPSLTA